MGHAGTRAGDAPSHFPRIQQPNHGDSLIVQVVSLTAQARAESVLKPGDIPSDLIQQLDFILERPLACQFFVPDHSGTDGAADHYAAG